jgi:hypothetical protein
MTLEPGQQSPSSRNPGDRSVVRLYIRDQHDPEIYENVKHCWIKSPGPTLVILHYYGNEEYRYVYWPLSNIRWWQIVPQKVKES